MKEYVYQSPKSDNSKNKPRRSDWIREGDVSRRRVLEARGWRIVETREAVSADAPAPALLPVPTPEAVDPLDALTGVLKEEQRAALVEAGFDTPDAIRAASDEDLRNLPTIGPGTVRALRTALAEEG